MSHVIYFCVDTINMHLSDILSQMRMLQSKLLELGQPVLSDIFIVELLILDILSIAREQLAIDDVCV